MGDDRNGGHPGVAAEAILEALPAAVFVVDGAATVRHATGPAAALVGSTPTDIVGRSVLEFVTEDTAWAYAAAVALATDYADVVMGPLRVSLVGADGVPADADLWATNRLDDPEIGGIVCLVTAQTTALGLSEAVTALVEGVPFGEVADRVVDALAGHPVVGQAVLVDTTGAARLDDSPAPVTAALGAEAALATGAGTRRLHPDIGDLEALDADLAAHAREHGYRALWVEPVPGAHAPPLALAVWRRRPGNPSPNQLRSTYQAAAILSLAARVTGADGG